MKERRLNEIKGVIFVAIGLIILASLVSFTPYDLGFYTSHPNTPPQNWIRAFGAYLGGLLLFLFGWASFFVPLFVIFLGVRLFRQEEIDLRIPRILGILVFLLSVSSLIGLSLGNEVYAFSRGGFLGFASSNFIATYFGRLGGYITFITLAILSLALVTEVLISTFFSHVFHKSKNLITPALNFKLKERPRIIKPRAENTTPVKVKAVAEAEPVKEMAPKPALTGKPKIQIKTRPPEAEPKAHYQEIQIGDYHLPTLDLLVSPPPLEARQIKGDLEANARILEETLADFGIAVKVTDIERGPVITRYELEPAPGVKLNRIVSLADDIALTMKAPSVRIVAPIPGKARVGIEVPNMQSNLVYLKETLISNEFQKSDSKLTLALGKDIAGHPVVADLADMPHLLIAGTTGSGKTVCVNSLILSMLFRCTPNELKLVMVDPKMVELAPFNGLPHLLCPVVTDAKKAAVALNWVVGEMEERYQLLAKAGARNIEAYNQKQEKIPYIVIIIDELADLMMVSRDQIETAITRLAQLSRAVGIHLILATQRPSVDVITGVIKANFPSRISFKVASKVDSRTVLDANGADKLLGKGDMLFLLPGEEKLIRAQGTLVTDKEIEAVVDFIKNQAEPVYDEEILKDQQKSNVANGEKDELYDQAVRVIMESNQASVSILQRRMRLGYTRAARIIDMMELEGMVGPFEGSKPRKILIDRDAWLEQEKAAMQKQEQG
ncbi:MAG: DNA translocase FtsK [Candidatus Omnitrophica bacterium]|nr:DNA translocase FtsK [Candidatus Omnitrophota bacterium]MDD5652730.1 DNA translocase FtsK [Candidatus Omnitrophota bacterium]